MGPVQGNQFTVGELRQQTYVLGYNTTGLVMSGNFDNLTSGNNTTFNNSDITINDNSTGTITITANLSVAGEYLAQFRGEPSNNASIQFSPIYSFRVVSPIL